MHKMPYLDLQIRHPETYSVLYNMLHDMMISPCSGDSRVAIQASRIGREGQSMHIII